MTQLWVGDIKTALSAAYSNKGISKRELAEGLEEIAEECDEMAQQQYRELNATEDAMADAMEEPDSLGGCDELARAH